MQVATRTLVLAAENDIMIPSSDEGKRLENLLPICRSKVLQNRSHALLQEAGVDLMEILDEEGFLVTERRMTGATSASEGRRRAGGFGKYAMLPTIAACLSAQL